MADEPHDVVKLLVARMESNPEEFNADDGRWAQWLDELMPFVTEEERVMLRKPMMQTIHEDVLDELLNGPEKRRKYEEDREYERQVMQQALQRNTSMTQPYGGGGGGGGGASLPVSTSPYQNASAQGIVGKSISNTWLDDYVYNGSITAAQPEPTLSKSSIDKIKQALGIKK